jgi:hypothetical protein
MTVSFGERLRYAAYAILAVLAIAAYFLMDTGQDRMGPGAARLPGPGEGLPWLRTFEGTGQREARRDLFAYGGATPGEAEPPPPPPVIEQAVAPPPAIADPLSGIRVDGLVRQRGVTMVLVRLPTAPIPITVALGERFGAGDALSVQSVEDRKVTVFNNSMQTSRIFTLSEE